MFFEGFNFGSQSIAKYLTEKLALLKSYNGLNVPADYFNEAMERLQARYLNIPLDSVLHPISNEIQETVQRQKLVASKAESVNQQKLTAQEWLEKGLGLRDGSDDEIYCYTQAILLDSDYAHAYNARVAARETKGDLDGAIKDYTEAIRLNPEDALAYINHGAALSKKGDLDGAIKDFNEAIKLNSSDINAHYNRANAWNKKENYYAAIADYQKYLELGGGIRYGDQETIEDFIKNLKKKIK